MWKIMEKVCTPCKKPTLSAFWNPFFVFSLSLFFSSFYLVRIQLWFHTDTNFMKTTSKNNNKKSREWKKSSTGRKKRECQQTTDSAWFAEGLKYGWCDANWFELSRYFSLLLSLSIILAILSLPSFSEHCWLWMAFGR